MAGQAQGFGHLLQRSIAPAQSVERRGAQDTQAEQVPAALARQREADGGVQRA